MAATTNFVAFLMKPLSRLMVGLIAIPLLRAVRRRIPGLKEWDGELEKDIDQWFRASLLLLVATKNAEIWLMGHVNLWIEANERVQWQEVDLNQWWITAGRLLLAISVVEAMPDQELFSIIHPGPHWRYNRKRSLADNFRAERWQIGRGLLCQHLNRSSPMFAILSVFFDGLHGWIFFVLAIAQYLIIGLVTSRDRALDVLSQFDRAVAERREEIVAEFLDPEPTPPAAGAACEPIPTLERSATGEKNSE